MDQPGRPSDDLLEDAESAFQRRPRYNLRPRNGSNGSASLQFTDARPKRKAPTPPRDYTSQRSSSRLTDENIAKHHGVHDDEVTEHIPLHFPGPSLAFLEMPRNFYEEISSEINRPRAFTSGGDSCSTVDSGYGPSVYDSTVDSGYGLSVLDSAPPISSYEPNDANLFLDDSLRFDFLSDFMPFDFFSESLLFDLPQELNLMVGQKESQPPHQFHDNGVVESESRSGLAGTECAKPKGFVNTVEPQVHSEKCGTRSESPPSGSMSTPTTGPNSIDTNNSVQGIQDKINHSRASIEPLSPDSDKLCHDQTGKEKANVKPQAHLGARQDIPADRLHENDGSIPQSPSHYAKITTSMATQSHGVELKRFLISKLMKKANELLGYTTSEASSNCASSDTSSDDTLSDGNSQSSRDVSPVGDEVETDVCISPSDGSHENERHRRDGGSITTSSAGVSEGPPPRSGNKRRRGVEDYREDERDEENCDKRRKSSKPSGDPQRKRRFACPFYKQNPAAYARCTACVWYGFETIARTKEHVYRNHREEHVCEICHETFESNRELLNHLMQPERCTAVDEPLQRVGINEDQKEKLGHRWRGIIDEEKWRKIYRICHNLNDDDPTPSPYWDDQDALASQAVEGYDQFQRNHLPSRIQELLEAEAESNPEFVRLYENLLARLPDVIREAQRGLYEAYTTLQGFGTTQNASRAQQTPHDNAAVPSAPLETPSAFLLSSGNAVSPPVAFEAPPNTENGMTANEAHEVHTQSNQQPNRNSDSGYGSTLVESQAELSRTSYISDPSGSHGRESPIPPAHPGEVDSLEEIDFSSFSADMGINGTDNFAFSFVFDSDGVDPKNIFNIDHPSSSAPYQNPPGT
ncbi:hypothetical protein BFW01_g3763 [Lasiodiplodia theobromae]|nr:hypothetical protein BFW01_g3763 [Lasiodiplodia theobromae]